MVCPVMKGRACGKEHGGAGDFVRVRRPHSGERAVEGFQAFPDFPIKHGEIV